MSWYVIPIDVLVAAAFIGFTIYMAITNALVRLLVITGLLLILAVALGYGLIWLNGGLKSWSSMHF
jgi:hypothetical protein